MSSIDRRVVEMEFDNKQFENGIKDTLKSLEALKEGLKLEGAAKGIDEVSQAGKNFNLDNIAQGVESISNKFSALGAIGFTVIQNLTNSALAYSKKISGLVLDPLISGGKQRALNIEAAEFQFRGLGVNVEKAMEDALYAVKGTSYGLDVAAKSAAQLSASQVELGDDMKTALRGISGVAAQTNSSYEDIAHVFTRVAGQGRVMANDLNSLASRGLNAAATLADAFGVTEAEIREMVSAGEVGFADFAKVLDDAFGENATKANETYTGSLSNLRAALSRIGASFFGPHIKNMRDLFNATTPVVDKLGDALKPVIDALVDMSTVRTSLLTDFLGNLDFTDLPDVLTTILKIAKDLFNIFVSIATPIKRAFTQIFPPTTLSEIGALLTRIEEFTNSIKMGADKADELRRTFAGVFAVFHIGWTIVKKLGSFLFNLFGIVTDGSGGILTATSNVGDFLVALDEAISKGTGLTSFFKGLTKVLTGPIKFIKALASALLSIFDFDAPDAENLTKAFEPLGRLGEIALSIWDRVLASLDRVFGKFLDLGRFINDLFGDIGGVILEHLKNLEFDRVLDVLNTSLGGGIFLMFQRIAKNTTNQVGSIAFNLTEPFRKLTYTMSVMQTTLRAMTLMQIAIAIGILAASVVALSYVDAAGLTKALSAMSVMFAQLMVSLKAFTVIGGVKGLIAISTGLTIFAVAIRILVSSVKALAELTWGELAKGLTGITVLISGLVLAVKGMSGNTAGMFTAGAGLLVLAAGIKVLVSAVKDFSVMSWEEIGKGLAGVGALLVSLGIFTRLVAANKAGVLQGAGLLLLAQGIKILASAVEDFAALSWSEIGKGLGTIGAILAAFIIFSKTVSPGSLVSAGTSLVLIGVSMNLLAKAMGEFAKFSWEEIAKGLASMAGALVAIVLALNLLPPNTLASATALVITSVALGLMANALGAMGAMSWEEIARGLTALAGAFIIIVPAMIAMTGTLAGAAATLVVAAALRVLTPVLKKLGSMSWGEIARGLVTLAGVFAIFGLAGLVLGPLVPVLLGLAGAVALFGVGIALAGVGVLAFATALTALAASGAAGTAAVVAIIAGIIGLIPMFIATLGESLILLVDIIANAGPSILKAISAIIGAIVGAIAENGPDIIDTLGDLVLKMVQKVAEITPQIVDAILVMLLGILDALIEHTPDIVDKVAELIVKMLKAITDNVDEMVEAAVDLLVGFLKGIANNIERVIDAGVDVAEAFINGITDGLVSLVDTAFNAIISFINGIADAIRDNTDELIAAGKNLASAIGEGVKKGLVAAIPGVNSVAEDLAGSALQAAKIILGIRSPSREFEKIGLLVGDGMVKGLSSSSKHVSRATEDLGKNTMDIMKKSIADISKAMEIDSDFNPVITPVLDLSEIKKGASGINASLTPKPIDIDLNTTNQKAKNASFTHQTSRENQNVSDTQKDSKSSVEFNYTQNNTSPKALSSAEIYRQTKNQLSVAKGALTSDATQET